MRRSLVVAAAVAALLACRSRSQGDSQPVKTSRAQPLATFTMQITAGEPSPRVVAAPPYVAAAAPAARTTKARAAAAPIPIVADGQPTNPEGTFELYSAPNVFKKWPAVQNADCDGRMRPSLKADVFLKAFTKESLRNVTVVYTNIDPAEHVTCARETPPIAAGIQTTAFGQRMYVMGDRQMWGNPAAPINGGPEEVVTWSFDYFTPAPSFALSGEIWAEPVPALPTWTTHFANPPDNANPPNLTSADTLTWAQVAGAPGDPVVSSVHLRLCGDPACTTEFGYADVTRSGGFSYALAGRGLATGDYWVQLFNQFDPGTGTGVVTGSLSASAKFHFTAP